MSALSHDPFGPPDGGEGRTVWPRDPGDRMPPARDAALRRWSPIGAEWDPLSEPAQAIPSALSGPQGASFAGAAAGQGEPLVGGARRVGGVGADSIAPLSAPGFPEARAPRMSIEALRPVDPPALTARADYSPSRTSYRLQRLWLTPMIRRFVLQGLPAMLLAAAAAAFAASPDRRAWVGGVYADARGWVEARPQFRIDRLEILTETPEVAQAVLARLGLELPVSSMALDLDAMQANAEMLDAVASASVQVRSGGVLEIRLAERSPAMIWRGPEGLVLVDPEGRRVARIASRAVRADLPLIAGEGAPAAIAEARLLYQVATPIHDRMVGLVRISERRWDLVLDNGVRVMLPAEGALVALEQVLALDGAQDLFRREITHVDMRNPVRPTIRLTDGAAAELLRMRTTGG